MRDETYFLASLNLLKDVFKRLFINKECVYLFGSRVRNDYNEYSDIDIAVENANSKTIILLRHEVENLNIPYKVKIIDLNEASLKIKEVILSEGIKIWGN